MAEGSRRSFGTMPDGKAVELLTLRRGPLSCGILTYGAAIQSLTVPGRGGKSVDVVLGFDNLENYRRQDKYIGATVGRYCNRIGGARFTLNGKEYSLCANNGANHLHGGAAGFDKQVWSVEELTGDTAVLSLFSPDGQEGYPGDLSVRLSYRLSKNALELEYEAVSDADTLCSLTNHSYFNLSGHASGPVYRQGIQLFADAYTPTDAASIPTGEIAPVEGTPMDLRTPRRIGDQIDSDFPQLRLAGGYDHNWVLGQAGRMKRAAVAASLESGVAMEVETTMPGVQFYTGNFLDGCPPGKGGVRYGKRHAFCLETQFFPDSPHHENFPDAVLRKEGTYRHKTIFHFYCESLHSK